VNPIAHNVYDYLSRKEELEEKYKINDAVQILVHIWGNL